MRQLNQLADVAQPIAAIEALRRNLLYAMLGGVTEGDMRDIVAAQVQKAKEGDTKAAGLIMGMVGVDRGGGSTTTHMQQAIVVGEGRGQEFLSEIRRQLVILISAEGPQQSAKLARLVHTELPKVLEAVSDHPWFEKGKDGWRITDQARTEVLAAAGG